MKKKLITFFCFCSIVVIAQKEKSTSLGKTTLEDLKMTVYDKDSSAIAVVLHDHGNLFIYNNNLNEFHTDYYYRIKILKKEGVRKATIKIPYFDKQEIKNINAITYNLSDGIIKRNKVAKTEIFKTTISGNWKEISFALPNVKVGSVIEYTYTLINPYLMSVDDWYFQDDIPKIKSEYDSSIVGNYNYNIKLSGYFPLTKNKPSIKKRCVTFSSDAYSGSYGDCSVLSYRMEHVPAFIEEEYLTSKENFISKISFQLQMISYASGRKEKFTDSWKSVDKKFKSGVYFGSELKKSSFFKKNLPLEILSIEDELSKAKAVFYFIQDHYTKSNENFSFQKINTKKSFDLKKGTVAEINMALFNALNSIGFKSNIVLLSTRNRGVPTKLYPVITEFNYIIVSVVINDQIYFLDASDKELTFGLPSFSSLNGDGRIMDFKKGSYWEVIKPANISSEKINLNIKITKENIVKGKLRVSKTGYDAYVLRNKLNQINKEDYKENYESKNQILINDYKVTGIEREKEQIVETFDFDLESSDELIGEKIYFNPFFHEKTEVNPFKIENRFYPVNFGYKRNYTFRAVISIPPNYSIGELTKSRAFSLPNNGGSFIFNIKKINSKITIFFKFQLNKVEYTNEEYSALKEFFNQIIKAQSTLITLEKIN